MKLLESLGGEETDGQVSDARVAGKSLLEDNGYKVIKKIGTGTYSKVKVFFLSIPLTPVSTNFPIKSRLNFFVRDVLACFLWVPSNDGCH